VYALLIYLLHVQLKLSKTVEKQSQTNIRDALFYMWWQYMM